MTTGNALRVLDPEEAAPPARREERIDFDALMRFAAEVVPTGFLPAHIKTAGQCVAIILTGRELGMAPMRAIRSLKLVEGKVIEDADSQLARFKSDGGRARFQTLTDERAVLWLRHPNGDEHTETFSIEDARRANLANKNVWKSYPKAMLRSRTITAGLKSIGYEGGVGAYGVEEAASFTGTPEPAVAIAALATDAQRDALRMLSARVEVFASKQCDGLADASASADTREWVAADLIRRAEAKVAKYEAAHPAPASADPTETSGSETTRTGDGDEDAPMPATDRLHLLRNRVLALLTHPVCASVRDRLTADLPTMGEEQLVGEFEVLRDVIAAEDARDRKRAQGQRRPKPSAATPSSIEQPDVASGELGTL